MSSTIHMCVVCKEPLAADDQVVRVRKDTFEAVGGEEVRVPDRRYAHAREEDAAVADDWTVTNRGILRDLLGPGA